MIERASFSDLSATDVYAISALRTDVFYLEQSCTEPEMDWRDLEDTAEHYFIRNGNDSRKIIAYLRVIDTLDEFAPNFPRTIGRVVVDAASRGRGCPRNCYSRSSLTTRIPGWFCMLRRMRRVCIQKPASMRSGRPSWKPALSTSPWFVMQPVAKPRN